MTRAERGSQPGTSTFVGGALEKTGRSRPLIRQQPCKSPEVAADYRHGTGHGVGAALAVHEIPPYIGQRFETSSELWIRSLKL